MAALLDLTSSTLASRCSADGEFRISARFWNGGLRLVSPTAQLAIRVVDGKVSEGDPGEGPGVVTLSAPDALWDGLLAAVPPRFLNDIWPLVESKKLSCTGDQLAYAQYLGAIMRAIEVLRPAHEATSRQPTERPASNGHLDAPVGRYIHLELEGQDYRVYFEEAGTGIPLLLQHTAGCHASQWRHLFENKEITDNFRLIAYDLPYHGKSNPPVGPKWWANEYKLTASFLRSVPVSLAKALKLDRPVFMGCSVGGMLALDLARYHADDFRAVISVEGALKVDFNINSAQLPPMWHPQVSSDHKARMMNSLMSPTSPEAYRKETSLLYASGWPQAFAGDLNYYIADYDLSKEGANIDTSKVGVHILSGEYDFTGTWEKGLEAQAAIAGSTFTKMLDVGHFPMSENPDKFIGYLLPLLEKISAASLATAD
jgi:pimeloyl-ACP methyl ester carboxylesterase